MSATPSGSSLSRFLSRDGWGWFVLSTLARMYLVFLLTLAAIALAPNVFGWHGSVVQTGSMEPHIHPGDVVVSSPFGDDSTVLLGTVVEYRSPASAEPSGEPRNRVHRIVAENPDGSYITAGDANAEVDSTPLTRDQIVGQARVLVPYVGLPQLWMNTRNFVALTGWSVLTLAALVVLAGPPLRRRPTRAAVAVAAVLAVVGVGAATAAPVPQSSAAFTTRTANSGNSWQVATAVDTRGYGNYRSAIAADRPWAYYPLDEASGAGTAQDQSGNDRDAAYSWFGVTLESTGALTRETNRGIALDGTAAAGFATPTAIPAPGTFTIELWFRTGTRQGGQLASFGDAHTGTSRSTSRALYLSDNGRLNFGARAGTATVVTSSRSYNDNAWHHVVATLSDAGTALYVDGARVAATSATATQPGSGFWRIGGDNLSGWPNRPSSTRFSGSIDEIAIYNSAALGAERVQAHHQAALPTTIENFPDEVAADRPSYFYHLDEGKGGPILDYAGGRQDSAYPKTGVTYNVTGVLSKRNNRAADFSGVTGSLIGKTAHAGPQVFSVETWFNTTTRRGGQLIGFGSGSGSSSSQHDRKLYMTNAGHLVFGVYDSGYRTISTPAAYNDGNWHHAVATLSPAGIRLYLDGELVASDAAVDSAEAYTGYWHIAQGQLTTWPSPPSSNNFDGRLDEIAVYSAALSDARVAAHYRAR